MKVRKHDVREEFFDVIDTEEKAYWLGFLSADGYVGTKSVKICLKSSDSGHLEKLRDTVGSTQRIRIYTTKRGTVQAYLDFNSTKLAKRLNELGLTAHKSFSLEKCKQIPGALEHHYWRGFIDGDGWVLLKPGRTGNQKPTAVIGLVGTKAILSSFRSFCKKLTGVTATPRKKKSVFQLTFDGTTKIVPILSRLYVDSTIYLTRKARKVEEVIRGVRCK